MRQSTWATAWLAGVLVLRGTAAQAEPPHPPPDSPSAETVAKSQANDSKRPNPRKLSEGSKADLEPKAENRQGASASEAKGAPGASASEAKGAPGAANSRRRSGNAVAAVDAGGSANGSSRARPNGISRSPSSPPQRVARVIPKQPCLRDPVVFERGFGGAPEPIVLTQCNGSPAPQSIEQLSILARPMSAAQPSVPTILAAVPHPQDSRKEWLPGVKLLDQGLVGRLQKIVDHFHAKKLIVVSGYRPASTGSFHQSAHAIDFLIDGVRNEALVAFCRTLPDTGCGYYPNSSFIHLDVRPPGTGHPYWIDASGPGESPRYVSSWPPPRNESARDSKPTRSFPMMPCDDEDHWDISWSLPVKKHNARTDIRTVEPAGRGRAEDDPFHP